MLPESQGPYLTPSSPLQVTMVDKGSITLSIPNSKEEQVQKEPSQEEEPQQMTTDEVSKEGKIVEYPQQASQDTEVQTTSSIETKTIEGEPSQRERTPRRSDKGKQVAKHTPSSSRGEPLVYQVLRWLRKEMMRNKKPQFNTDEEDMIKLAKVLNKPESPSQEARALAFINSTRNQDLFSQVAIPPPDADVESLGP